MRAARRLLLRVAMRIVPALVAFVLLVGGGALADAARPNTSGFGLGPREQAKARAQANKDIKDWKRYGKRTERGGFLAPGNKWIDLRDAETGVVIARRSVQREGKHWKRVTTEKVVPGGSEKVIVTTDKKRKGGRTIITRHTRTEFTPTGGRVASQTIAQTQVTIDADGQRYVEISPIERFTF